MPENLVDAITFRAVAPVTVLPGLDAAHAKLKAIALAVDALNGKLNALSIADTFKRTRKELEQTLQSGRLTKGKISAKEVSTLLGVPNLDEFKQYIARWKATHKDWNNYLTKGGDFLSAGKASVVAQGYFRKLNESAKQARVTLASLMGGGNVPPPPAAVAAPAAPVPAVPTKGAPPKAQIVPVTVDVRAAQAEIVKLERRLAKLKAPPVVVSASSTKAQAEIAKLQARLAELKRPPVPVMVQSAAAQAEIAKIEQRLAKLKAPPVVVSASSAKAQAEIAKLEARLTALKATPVPLAVQSAAAQAEIAQIEKRLAKLKAPPIPVTAESKRAQTEIAKIEAQLAKLKSFSVLKAAPTSQQAQSVHAEIAKLEQRLAKLKAPPVVVSASSAKAQAEIAKLQTRLAELKTTNIPVTVQSAAAKAEIAQIEKRLAKLQATQPLPIGPRLEGLAAKKAAGEKLNLPQNKFLKSVEAKNKQLFAAFEARVAELKGGAPSVPTSPSAVPRPPTPPAKTQAEIARLEQRLAALKASVPSVPPLSPSAASPVKPVVLTVPPAQIQAVLGPGMIKLVVPPGQVTGVSGAKGQGAGGAGGGKGPPKVATGAAGAAGSGGGGNAGKAAATKLRDTLASINRDLVETIEKLGNQPEKIAAARKKAAGQIRRAVGTSGIPIGTKITEDALARAAIEQDKAGKLLEKNRADTFKRRRRIQNELDRARERGEEELITQLTREKAEADRAAKRSQSALNRFHKTGQTQRAAIEKAREKTATFDAEQLAAGARTRIGQAAAQSALADFLARGGAIKSDTRTEQLGRRGASQRGTVVAELEQGGKVERLTAKFDQTGASVTRLTRSLSAARAEAGLLAGDFLRNTVKVTAWTASVGLLYSALGLVRFSMQSLIETGAQTARLEQVFRGVGGSAQDLTRDVLHLAAVNGRSSQEAMQSAVQWSRLGLTRAQVNEAVRVSLMAANVAELSAAEATEKLQGVMQNYGLQVGQLRTVLGQLNTISNTYNVTNADMLEGISRTSAVAKQAGLPLAELMGIIGATVGATGQTGANIGNAVKSITVALGNPALQKKLRETFAFETSTGGDEIKTMSQLLADLFVRYQHLNDAQRQSLLFQTAGKTQASRLAAVLDNYVKAQVLAINAQLNLNSAEEENAKIKATLKSQLQGLATEWERFVNIQGQGPAKVLGEVATALRNVLTLMNAPGVKLLTTGLLGLGAAGAARLALGGLRGGLSGGGGFVSKSLLHARAIAGDVALLAAQSFGSSANRTGEPRGRFGRALDRWNALISPPRLAPGGIGPTAPGGLAGWASRGGTLRQAVGVGAMGLWAGLPIAIAATAGILAFNKAVDALGLSSEDAEKRLAGFNQEAEKARSAAAAFKEAADLIGTLDRALRGEKGFKGMDGSARTKFIEQASQAMFLDEPDTNKRTDQQKAFATEIKQLDELARKTGDRTQLEARLREVQAGFFRQRQQQLRAEFAANLDFERKNNAKIAELKGQNQGPLRNFGFDTRQSRIKELEALNTRAGAERVQLLNEQATAEEDFYQKQLENDEKHISNLERMRLGYEAIGEFFRSIPANNPLERAGLEMAALSAQSMAWEARRRELDRLDETDVGGQSQIEARLKQLQMEEEVIREQMRKVNEANRPMTPAQRGIAEFNEKAQTRVSFGFWRDKATVAQEEANAEYIRLRRLQQENREEQAKARLGQLPAGQTGLVSRMSERQEGDRAAMERRAREEALRRNLPIFELQTRAQLTREEAGRDVRRQSFGRNETESLLRQNRLAAGEIERISAVPPAQRSLEQQVRLVDMMGEAYRTLNELRNRGAEVERELGQLQSDRLRELRESILGAGPAELLRKLAAMRTSFDERGNIKNISAGQFLSFSPGFRQDVNQMNPRFDPRRLELEEERKQLAGITGSFEKFLANLTAISEARLKEAANLKLPETFTAGLEAVAAQSQRAASELGKLADNVTTLNQRIQSLETKPAAGAGSSGLQTGGGGQLGGKGGAAGYAQPFENYAPMF